MAKTAKRKSGTQAPISAHPAFPAIVALWFAALFGIGSLVLPSVLMERMLGSAPDFTTRLMIALGCSLIGALGGLFIARKVTGSHSESGTSAGRTRRSASRNNDNPVKRPIVATEELGEEGLGPVEDDHGNYAAEPSKPALPGRRRALAVTDDTGRSEYFASVPLPGEEESFGYNADDSFDTPEPLDLVSQPEEEPIAFQPAEQAGQAQETHQAEFAQSMDALRNPVGDEIHAAADAEPPAPAMFTPNGDAAADARPFDGPSFQMPHTETPAVGESVAFSPLAAQSAAEPDDPFAAAAPLFEPAAAEPEERQVFGAGAAEPRAVPAFAPQVPTGPAAPLAELPMSELIGRFTAALEKDLAEKAESKFARETAGDANPVEPAPAVPPPFNPFGTSEPAPVAAAAIETAPFFAAAAPHADQAAAVFAPAVNADSRPAPFAAPAAADSNAETETADIVVEADDPLVAALSTGDDRPVPAALRPLDLGAFEEEEADEGDDPFASGLSLNTAGQRQAASFAPPAPPTPAEQSEAPQFAASAAPDPHAAVPAAFAPPFHAGDFSDDMLDDEAETDQSGDDSGYSSLLSMKSSLGSQTDFVRIEDDEDEDADRPPEAAVVFPQTGSAAPNAQATTPASVARPFDSPAHGAQGRTGLPPAAPTAPAARPADPAETEKALREALDKLQRMSGAA